jgi:hypothetical protein
MPSVNGLSLRVMTALYLVNSILVKCAIIDCG